MGYIERNLADGERIVYKTKPHAVIFCIAFLWALPVSLAAFLLGQSDLAEVCLGLAVAIGLCLVAWRSLSEFAVTNRRVFGKYLKDYSYPDVSLMDAITAEFRPGFLGSLFYYGTVVIIDRRGGKHEIGWMPTEFYRQIQARLARNERILK